MLNVAAISESGGAVGPGRFLVVWLQGCRKRCRGCTNAAFLPIKQAKLVTAAEIGERLHGGLTGICFSGGEPFLQAGPLLAVARAARAADYAVVSYSGYTLEQLQADVVPHARELVSQLDILIDGEFVRPLAGNLLWRGSSNQKIHLLSRRFPQSVLDRPPATSVCWRDTSVVTVGTPNPALQKLFAALAESGCELRAAPIGGPDGA